MEHPQNPAHHHTGIHHDAVTAALMACANACDTCTWALLDTLVDVPAAHCIELARDTADICRLAARLLLRDSENARDLLAVCVAACRLCGDECARHEREVCQRCAASCRACAGAAHALEEDSL